MQPISITSGNGWEVLFNDGLTQPIAVFAALAGSSVIHCGGLVTDEEGHPSIDWIPMEDAVEIRPIAPREG